MQVFYTHVRHLWTIVSCRHNCPTKALGDKYIDRFLFAVKPSFLHHGKGTGFKVTMSFGFSVGDFITAIELANKIRKDFATAPSQLKGISNE